MKVTVTRDDFTPAARKIKNIDWDAIIHRNLTEIFNRGKKPGGTPFKTGELRLSLTYEGEDVVGYTKEYAPHVEYGHRTRSGGYMEGQHYLQANVDEQRAIFEADVKKAIKAAAEGGNADV